MEVFAPVARREDAVGVAQVVLGHCPVRGEVRLGVDPQCRLIAGDGTVEVRRAVSQGRLRQLGAETDQRVGLGGCLRRALFDLGGGPPVEEGQVRGHVAFAARLLGLIVPGGKGLLGVELMIVIPREGREFVGVTLCAGLPIGSPVLVGRANSFASPASWRRRTSLITEWMRNQPGSASSCTKL